MKMYIVLLSLIAVISLQGMKKERKKLALEIGSAMYQHKKSRQDDRIVIKQEKHTGKSFFGVFDGHDTDGGAVAEYLKDNLYNNFNSAQGAISQKLEQACETTNTDLLKLKTLSKSGHLINESGSTACVAYIDVKTSTIFFANVGDSRGMAISRSKSFLVTRDHAFTDQDEKDRFIKDGGKIEFNLANGILKTFRAFGDAGKGEGISAIPDIYSHKLEEGDFIIIATDGLYDEMDTEEVASLCKSDNGIDSVEKLNDCDTEGNKELSAIAASLINEVVKRSNQKVQNGTPTSGDNIAIVVAKVIAAKKVSKAKVEIKNPEVKSKWGFLPAMITNNPWPCGILAAALVSGLVYYLKYLK